MAERNLRESVIRLAHANPELQGHLLPLLKDAAVDVAQQSEVPTMVARTIDDAISMLRMAKVREGKMKVKLVATALETLIGVIREDMATDQTVTGFGTRELRRVRQNM
jgi:hypothetical protein